jgi:hypothetical protein
VQAITTAVLDWWSSDSPPSLICPQASARRVAINTHAFVAETAAQADAAFAPSYLSMMNRIGRERGWPAAGRPEYEALRAPDGALAVGFPEQVAEKILFEHELFGHQRYIAQMSVGAVAHRDVLRSIELFATEVTPVVRAETARRGVEPSSGSATTPLRLPVLGKHGA